MGLRQPDMVTTRGHFIWFDKPELAYIDMQDVRLGLSNIRRYNGGLDWTLNKHVWLVADLMQNFVHPKGTEAKREIEVQCGFAVAHDFHEIYMTDVVNGLKKHLPAYANLEDNWEAHLHNQIGLVYDRKDHALVKKYDMLALCGEMRALGHPSADMCRQRFDFTPEETLYAANRVTDINREAEPVIWTYIEKYLTRARHILWEEQLED